MENVIITGVSTGIGYSLAKLMLGKGYKVFGISRTVPENLMSHENFFFKSIDVSVSEKLSNNICDFLLKEYAITSVKYLFLNAGLFGNRIAPLHAVPTNEIDYVMRVNVWSYKYILDALIKNDIKIHTCIISSSIAGVRARAGNSAYAISKAALNMLCKLYALEQPHTFFAVLGLCNVDTYLSRTILNLPLEGSFPEMEDLRLRGKTNGYVISAAQRAEHILFLLQNNLENKIKSGEFSEIRNLLKDNF